MCSFLKLPEKRGKHPPPLPPTRVRHNAVWFYVSQRRVARPRASAPAHFLPFFAAGLAGLAAGFLAAGFAAAGFLAGGAGLALAAAAGFSGAGAGGAGAALAAGFAAAGFLAGAA